ncbi:hypothetical protein B0J13DRAFT_106091 [Dactylonectria estremocensis]|uniref:Uncharacterized protein n=1 Tax=Dactylonectria estremocensis TaxID=1079267 RepID=A0A9P9IUH6_9HYPO|nr:hypothetical protein B0J13DRAFT_106091 [Dactylonectria estremocensis]
MSRTGAFLTVALAGSVIANPLQAFRPRSNVTANEKSSTVTTTTIPAKCNAGDTSTTDGVQALLDDTGAVAWLDIMLVTFPNNEADWLNKLWTTVFPNEGSSPLSGCGSIGGDCNIDTMCQDYSTPMAYWIIKSVAMLHSKINTVHSMLLWDGWLAGLSIDQIAKDFSSTSPNQEWAKWVAAAFSMAGGIATGIDLSKPLRGMIGFASAGLTDVSLTKSSGDAVDVTSVENTLRNMVGAAGNYVASILQNAIGSGEADTLPIYTYTTLQFATSRFFYDNTILLDENKDNSSFVSAYNSFGTNIEQKLVDIAMKTAWYVLVAEEDVEEADCNMTGALWLQAKDTFRCFYLTRPMETSNCGNDDPSTCVADAWEAPYNSNNKFDNGVYTKLTDTYGFDLNAYYTSLIDCAINGDGTVDMTAFTSDGKLPRCFFSGYVRSGYWYNDGTAMLNLYFHGNL